MSSKSRSLDLMKSCNLNNLPVEIKLKLLRYLPVRDLRSIVRSEPFFYIDTHHVEFCLKGM